MSEQKYIIEVKPDGQDHWQRFTKEPLVGLGEAEKHLQRIIEVVKNSGEKERLRIVPYTLRHELWDIVERSDEPLETAKRFFIETATDEEIQRVLDRA